MLPAYEAKGLAPADFPSQPAFRIENIYLEEHLPLLTPEAQHAATQKLIDAALKLDPSVFKYAQVDSFFATQGVVANVHCEESDDPAQGCQIATNLGNEFHFEFAEETAKVLVTRLAEYERARLPNVFQILFGGTVVDDFPQADVNASTVFSRPPFLQGIPRS